MLLNARRVFDKDGSTAALLLAIEDVTQRREAEREKDELLRQKEVLLEEMQHRVANGLQIIASILLLKARTVQSEEIRLHLHDAHQRVMSVATVQQQLQASGLNESIEIGPYLCKLCDSLAKSMVGDRLPVSIKVQATSGKAVSEEAVSLGVIVTELVINALKHAFPSGEEGEILVSYDAQHSGCSSPFPTTDQGQSKRSTSAHVAALVRLSSRPLRNNSKRRSRNLMGLRGPRSLLLPPQSAGSCERVVKAKQEASAKHSQANDALTKIDDEEPEDIVRHRIQTKVRD